MMKVLRRNTRTGTRDTMLIVIDKETDHTRETNSYIPDTRAGQESSNSIPEEYDETNSFYSDTGYKTSPPPMSTTIMATTTTITTALPRMVSTTPILMIEEERNKAMLTRAANQDCHDLVEPTIIPPANDHHHDESTGVDDCKVPTYFARLGEPLSSMSKMAGVSTRRLCPASVKDDFASSTHDDDFASSTHDTCYSVDTMYESIPDEDEDDNSSDDDDDSTNSSDSEVSGSSFDTADDEDDDEYYRTIDQNQFFGECFGNSGRIFVHFFNPDTQDLCEQIDNELSILASKYASSAKFLRINGRLAPFFTAKLRVKTLPSVVAIRNGEVDGCVSTFENGEVGYIQNWMLTTGLIS